MNRAKQERQASLCVRVWVGVHVCVHMCMCVHVEYALYVCTCVHVCAHGSLHVAHACGQGPPCP